MRVVEVEAVEVSVGDVLEAVVAHLRRQASDQFEYAHSADPPSILCRDDYVQAIHRLASDLENAGERFDAAVQRHLEGPCKAH